MKSTYEEPRIEMLFFPYEDLLNVSGDGVNDADDTDGPGNAIELPKINF